MENSKCVNCGEIREENFDICWNCGYQFEVIVNNPTNDYKEEEINLKKNNGTTEKLNSAGKSLKAIAKTTMYLLITNFIFICGILLSGVLDTKFYVIIGIVEIIMVINIIYELFNAGNELMSISSNDSKVKE
jgi:hypothetical protein